MIWLRVSITSIFLFVVIYLQFFVDFDSLLDNLTIDDENTAMQSVDQSRPAQMEPTID